MYGIVGPINRGQLSPCSPSELSFTERPPPETFAVSSRPASSPDPSARSARLSENALIMIFLK
ncbi:hypothetical protein A2U01_0057677, partial [Trifolium medium]|nr:hypothetical protein [Trifolium medium]